MRWRNGLSNTRFMRNTCSPHRDAESSSQPSSATNPGNSASHAATGSRFLANISGLRFLDRRGSSSCIRHCTLLVVAVRCSTSTSLRSVSSRKSRDTGSCCAPGKSGSRSAARAISVASIESDLPRVRAEARVWAISFVGTRTTDCPALISSCSRRPDTVRTSSIAHVSSGPNFNLAHFSAEALPALVACTVFSPSGCPRLSIATQVCVRLCGSTPIVRPAPRFLGAGRLLSIEAVCGGSKAAYLFCMSAGQTS